MRRDNGERLCDGCSQILPAASKLSRQILPPDEARQYGIDATGDDPVTIDLCLQCRLKRSNNQKRGYA